MHDTRSAAISTLDQIRHYLQFKFVPATFKIVPKVIIRFVNVSNITLSAALHKANITCLGENSGFSFRNVSRLAIHNLQFIGCAGEVIIITGQVSSSLSLMESSDVRLQNVTTKHGKGYGIIIICY